MRIVSLVPSLTETICQLGMRANVVGCTQFCVRPADLHRTAVLIGGTKDPNLSIVADLSPDLIVVNSEENRTEDISRCKTIARVFETFPKSPSDVPSMVRALGMEIGAEEDAQNLAVGIESQIIELQQRRPGRGASFLYFIWKNPYMVAARDTYISQSLELAGFVNVIDQASRYPSLELQELKSLSPQLVFLSTEPYPFRKRDVPEISFSFPNAERVLRIDGQLMSWFGGLTSELLGQLARWPDCDSKFVRMF